MQESHDRVHQVEIIGNSVQTRAMLDFVGIAAGTDSTVLLEGESGTGKELMARAIHRASARATKPFIAVNCGAINPNLIESELFGHEKGAFTGAVTRKPGHFERANCGTLLLDEIGELPLQDQVKLLRALQERRIMHVGGTNEIYVNVRIIAATNRNLYAEVEARNFRLDLYYRLAVLTFTLPPLRGRPDDVLLLAKHFLDLYSKRLGIDAPSLTPEAEARLLNYHWPGNIRELENVIERTIIFCRSKEIKAESLIFPTLVKVHSESGKAFSFPVEKNEMIMPANINLDDLALHEKRELIKQALKQCYGNRENAAKMLGLSSRFQLYRLMKKLGISDDTSSVKAKR